MIGEEVVGAFLVDLSLKCGSSQKCMDGEIEMEHRVPSLPMVTDRV